MILPVLNGLAHLDQLSSRFPENPVWGGLAHLGVTMDDNGTIRHLNDLSIIQFGPRAGAADKRAAPDRKALVDGLNLLALQDVPGR